MSKFVQKTLKEIFEYIRDALYAEEYARRGGFLQRREVRVKIVSLLLSMIAVSLSRNVYFILGLLSFIIIDALASRISLVYFFKRIVLTITLFAVIISLPYIFNIFQPEEGTNLVILARYDHIVDVPFLRPFTYVSITKEGVEWALLLVSRISMGACFALLLIMSTRWNDLLHGLKKLKVPDIIITMIGMTFRYIFLLFETLIQMLESRRSRLVGREGFVKAWKLNSSLVGALFLKSHDLSNNIYMAMVSRGFSDEIKTLHLEQRRSRAEKAKDMVIFLQGLVSICLVFLI